MNLTHEMKEMLKHISESDLAHHSTIPFGHRKQDLDYLARFDLIKDEGDGSYSITPQGRNMLSKQAAMISDLETRLAAAAEDQQLKNSASKGIMWIREFSRHLNAYYDEGVSLFTEDEERQVDSLLNKLDHMLVKIEKEV